MEHQHPDCNPESDNTNNYFLKITVVEAIAAAIILITVLVMKFFFKDQFLSLKKIYRELFLSDTSVSEVLDAERTDYKDEI